MSLQDVALGSDGAIIICTESGHVFVRARTSGKTFKFQRVPCIQRVISVGANDTGAVSALRIDFRPESVHVVGNSLAQDLARVQPYLRYKRVLAVEKNARVEPNIAASNEQQPCLPAVVDVEAAAGA